MASKQGKAPYIDPSTLDFVLRRLCGPNAARNSAILHTSHYLGLRAEELAALTLGDVLTRHGELRDAVRLLKHMTKGAKFREVYLVHPGTRASIQAYLRTRGTRAPERPLFLSQKGDGFSANTMQRLIGNLYRAAGVPGSSHSGRRSFATNFVERGADVYGVMTLMGHASITTTQEYLHSSPERLRKLSGLLT